MTKKQKKNLIRILVTAGLLAALLIFEDKLPYAAALILYLLTYLVIGYDILWKAIRGIMKGSLLDENFLMALASVGAMLLREFSEGIAVMLFYQVGELFEGYAVGKSRRNISALMDIRPDYAMVERDGEAVKTDPDEVEIGSIIQVSPGEKIPIDGVVVTGSSLLDTAALTGESVPRSVGEGTEVISGSINLNGMLRIKTTKEFGESTASKILELVENASSRKSHSENFISRFARIYTPAVCGGALLLAILVPLIRLMLGMTPGWSDWVYRALTFLVISCPCALVISIPLTFFAGIGGAGREGVLVKGSNYLELLSRTRYVAFDKTGTVTKGIFAVSDINEKAPFTENDLLKYAAHAEGFSSHPISMSLINEYKNRFQSDIDKGLVLEVTEIGGHGVKALVDGKCVLAGNQKLMGSHNIECEAISGIGTFVHVAVDGVYAGSIRINDEIKENSEKAIKDLYKAGIKDTVMLTGDYEETGKHVAGMLGIKKVFAELLPAEKVETVERLLADKKKNEAVVFVGDGINDAPVLSRADIGIAMGALGSDAAIEAADIVLMDDNPEKIAKAIRISKKCIRIVYENIYFALGVKALCLALGALGIANMWLAIFADVGVMIIAVLNAIRALNVKGV